MRDTLYPPSLQAKEEVDIASSAGWEPGSSSFRHSTYEKDGASYGPGSSFTHSVSSSGDHRGNGSANYGPSSKDSRKSIADSRSKASGVSYDSNGSLFAAAKDDDLGGYSDTKSECSSFVMISSSSTGRSVDDAAREEKLRLENEIKGYNADANVDGEKRTHISRHFDKRTGAAVRSGVMGDKEKKNRGRDEIEMRELEKSKVYHGFQPRTGSSVREKGRESSSARVKATADLQMQRQRERHGRDEERVKPLDRGQNRVSSNMNMNTCFKDNGNGRITKIADHEALEIKILSLPDTEMVLTPDTKTRSKDNDKGKTRKNAGQRILEIKTPPRPDPLDTETPPPPETDTPPPDTAPFLPPAKSHLSYALPFDPSSLTLAYPELKPNCKTPTSNRSTEAS